MAAPRQGDGKLDFRRYLEESGAIDHIFRVLKEVYELECGSFSQPASSDVLLTAAFQRLADERLRQQLVDRDADIRQLHAELRQANQRYLELLDNFKNQL